MGNFNCTIEWDSSNHEKMYFEALRSRAIAYGFKNYLYCTSIGSKSKFTISVPSIIWCYQDPVHTRMKAFAYDAQKILSREMGYSVVITYPDM